MRNFSSLRFISLEKCHYFSKKSVFMKRMDMNPNELYRISTHISSPEIIPLFTTNKSYITYWNRHNDTKHFSISKFCWKDRNRRVILTSSLALFLAFVVIYGIKKYRRRMRNKKMLEILTNSELIDGYLFDFDDTLVNSDAFLVKDTMEFGINNFLPSLKQWWRPKNLYVGFMIAWKQLYQDHDETMNFIYDHYEKEILDHCGATREEFVTAFMNNFVELYRTKVKFFPNSKKFLNTLKRKNPSAKFCLTTNSCLAFVKAVPKDEVNVFRFFDEILTFEDFEGKAKPNPYAYEKSAKKIGSVTGRCVVFEDSRGGIRAARGAGCFVVGLLNGVGNTKKKLRNADLVISMEELMEVWKKEEVRRTKKEKR